MISRRSFIRNTALASIAVGCQTPKTASKVTRPIVISTWKFGLQANAAAWKVLQNNGAALDAVEQGVKVVEADPEETSVGYGGLPDRDGFVTLDACIMNEKGQAGSVCALQHIVHPISVARLVMEKTPHVMLVGDGALQFALSEGFEKKDLLTPKAKKAWEEWKKTSNYKPIVNIENHDTIGMIAIDKNGNLSGACTTSGMAYKMHGRVGDSPIIGAGLFVDNEVGGAVATGVGELVLRTLGTYLVVELMRQGRTPQQACEEAVRRIVKQNSNLKDFQVGFLAINKQGETGAFALQNGFNYAVFNEKEGNKLFDAKYELK